MKNTAQGGEVEKTKRFALHRKDSDEKKKEKERSDDLTQMMNRASNYMTLAFVKIPSMVLCLSYKGHGKRNLEDVHDLVFRMPTLEYRNKTWSNLDLALQLKKDVIRALISHAGAIVGNKFSHHKPSKLQQSRLREIANMSTFMSPNASMSGLDSESSSVSLKDSGSSNFPGRPSTASARPSTLNQSLSVTSTPSAGSSTNDLEPLRDSITVVNGQANGRAPSARGSSLPRSSPSAPDSEVRNSYNDRSTCSSANH
jgi:hypothetical protein